MEFVRADQSLVSIESDNKENENESEDWCFVCHNGGTIRECDFPKCGKAYHYKCVGQRKSFLTSNLKWNCAWHSCSICGGKSKFICYCCPEAICHQCLDSAEFFPIRQEKGFCKDCLSFVMRVEGIMDSDSSMKRKNLGDLSTREEHLKEYYEIIKKQDGLDLGDLQSAKRQWKSREKRKSCRSLDDASKNKRARALPKILDVKTGSHEEEMLSSKTATSFAAIIPDNIRLVYLRRTLVEKLSKQPESFDKKVKGTFVHVELPSHDGRRGRNRRFVQVTGTRRTSVDQDSVDIKLLASDIPNEISIDTLSNVGLREEDCEDLRQQIQNGLLRRPTVEELEQKARVLHEDMVDDSIALELKKLQAKIDIASEKGYKREKYEHLYRRTQLESPSERQRLIKALPVVIPEIVGVDVICQGTADDRRGTEGSPVSISIKGAQCTNNCRNLNNTSTNSVGKTISDPMPTLKDIMDNKRQNEGPAMVILDKECKGSITAVSFKRSLCGSTPDEKHVRKLVNDAVELVLQTTDTETNKDPQQLFPEIELDKLMEGQTVKGMTTAMNTAEPCFMQTPENQHPIPSVPASLLQGKVMAPAVDNDPTTMQQSNRENYSRRELEFLSESLLNFSKSIALVVHELKNLKAKVEEDSLAHTTKISNMEKKLDLMVEHHLRQFGDAQAEPAKEELTTSSKSKILERDVTMLFEPIKRAGWTEALEVVKAKHVPHLDLFQFPMYDPDARAKADFIAKGILEYGIQLDHLVLAEATEKDCHERNSGQHLKLGSAQELETFE